MAKKPLILQKCSINDVYQSAVRSVEEGGHFTASARPVGTVVNEVNGRIYTIALVATCDDDDPHYDPEKPVIDQEDAKAGTCYITAPEGLYPSCEPVDADTLTFPEE